MSREKGLTLPNPSFSVAYTFETAPAKKPYKTDGDHFEKVNHNQSIDENIPLYSTRISEIPVHIQPSRWNHPRKITLSTTQLQNLDLHGISLVSLATTVQLYHRSNRQGRGQSREKNIAAGRSVSLLEI